MLRAMLRPRLPLAGLFPATLFGERAESVLATGLKSGNMVLLDGKYCEVSSTAPHKSGRGAATVLIQYLEIAEQKKGEVRVSAGAKVERCEMEKMKYEVLYMDHDNQQLVVADPNYEQHELPAKAVAGAEQYLEPGMQIHVWRHDDEIVKLQLPHDVLQKIKKK